ncbi:MAG: LacI family DNA-binding transcriptional regulator [Ruminococcus sp.]|nr:LacI family DNA-binding transcriptional regulator [Ruminococcus sp.]
MKDSEKKPGYVGIREIARMAGVSTATVSRVINRPEKTSPKVREQVEKIIEEYQYVPNQAARNIFSKTSNSIALFVYDMENPFFVSLIRAINKLCLKKNLTLLICATEDDAEQEKEYLEYCISNRCAGIILTEGCNYKIFEPYRDKIPLIFLDRRSHGHYSSVSSNNRESLARVVDYLYNLNHRRIGFIGCKKDLDSVKARQKGYLQGLTAHSLSIQKEYIYENNTELSLSAGKEALNYFLSLPKPPTSIICCADIVALGILNQAAVQNIKIPDELSIVGFDNVLDNLHSPPITTVRQNVDAMAAALIEMILSPPDPPIFEIVETTFIPGTTCQKTTN